MAILIAQTVSSQYTHRIKADSVLITKDSSSNELIIENLSVDIKGFLYNRGVGRTEFKQAMIQINDSTYVFGSDSIHIPSRAFGANWWMPDGNARKYNWAPQLGSNDNQHVVLRTNNLERMRLTADGNFLIGTTVNSVFKMDVAGRLRATFDSYINQIRIGRGAGDEPSNTVFGTDVLHYNTIGNFNTAIGFKTMFSNLTGASNTALGYKSLHFNTSGQLNTAIGGNAMSENTTGSENTALGFESLHNNTSGEYNTAIGRYSLAKNLTGSQNTAIGDSTLMNNSTGSSNTAAGSLSLSSNTTGSENNAFGEKAMKSNTSGINNAAFGTSALELNSSGTENVAIGNYALQNNSTGTMNSSVGFESLLSNTEGSYNTGLGHSAMKYNTTGSNNTGAGHSSLRSNTTGDDNAAAGFQSLFSNLSGTLNTSLGYSTLYSNNTGTENSAIGLNSLHSNTSGSGNVSIGGNSLYATIAANNNIAIGYNSANTLTTGDTNIFIGNDIQPNIGTTNSNQLNLGNWIYGDRGLIGIGLSEPKSKLHLAGGESASGNAPLKLNSGTLMNTPENGAVEYNGSNYYITAGGTRYILARTLTADNMLNFGNTTSGNSNDLTITLTGVAEGDPVIVVPSTSVVLANTNYTAFVSSADTVTIRFNNFSITSQDPPNGNFKVVVFKY
ncbi:MAG: hypothetical protein NVV59_08895 [Chitinophagaceae bacterium]|nr:hypothetical protein [Chitinophagaceae bacterium]